jgi:hypothetical protein
MASIAVWSRWMPSATRPIFEAYALGDDSDWTWLASTQPERGSHCALVLGKVLDDAWCRLPSSIYAPSGRAGELYGDRAAGVG